MKAKETEKEWMQKDMERVIHVLKMGDHDLPETDFMRLEQIKKDGRLKDFEEFYRLAGRMKDERLRHDRQNDEKQLTDGLTEIQEHASQYRKEIKRSQLGSDGVGQTRQKLRQELKQRLDQREEEHRQKLAEKERVHVAQMKTLWSETEVEIKLLEDQISLYQVKLETLSTNPATEPPGMPNTQMTPESEKLPSPGIIEHRD